MKPTAFIALTCLITSFSLKVAIGAPIDTYVFTTVPADGLVQGPPGSTVGWGYSITNESPVNWLVTTELNAGLFVQGTPDSSVFDFPIVAPGQTVTQIFDPANATGLYAFTWDATAQLGISNIGFFALGADWWNGDPASGATFLSSAPVQNTSYDATETIVSANAPEPISLALCSFGIIWVICLRIKAALSRTSIVQSSDY